MDILDLVFVIWAFFLQIVLIVHFAIRKRFLNTYTLKIGWIVYALGIPAAMISVVQMFGGKSWEFWTGGLLFASFGLFGVWVEYIKKIHWRKPLRISIALPYLCLYLSSIMFYWWPLGRLSLSLWLVFSLLFSLAAVLNIRSH